MKSICYFYKEEPREAIDILNIEDQSDPMTTLLENLREKCLESIKEGYSIFDWMEGYSRMGTVPPILGYFYIDPAASKRVQMIDIWNIVDPELDQFAETNELQAEVLYLVCRIFGADPSGNPTTDPPEFEVTVPTNILELFETKEEVEWCTIKKIETEEDAKRFRRLEEYGWSKEKGYALYATDSHTGNDSTTSIEGTPIKLTGRLLYSFPDAPGRPSGSRSISDLTIIDDGKDLWWRQSSLVYKRELED